ncbi:uncharacterized protein LOC131186255 isoform X2 [Ahaetulla prasina]|uniref:uncharacterized protein LOC131186255 isoform X2 n=1 Tax=Ahaetulla prasina TaxID=499056 RepID=UPI0026483B60|nr:uncharacterized protein LOC131186255 isoform X2 [Ahaetulla prasina]
MQRSESAYGAPSVLAGLGPCCNDAPAGNFSSSRAQEGDKESGWDSRASSNTPRSGGCQQLSVRKYQTQQLTNKPIHLAPRLGKNHQAEIPTEGDGDENPGCRFQEEGQTGLPGGMPKAAPREAGGTKENNYL